MSSDRQIHPSELLEFRTVFTGGGSIDHTVRTASSSDTDEKHAHAQRYEGFDGTAKTMHDAVVAHQERRVSIDYVGLPAPTQEATAATQKEHRMTLWDSLHDYPKAIFWSMLLSMAIIMEGYDTALINGFFAMTEFRKRYGVLTPDEGYQITTAWQSGLNNGALCGEIFGLFVNGYATERFGYRKTMIGALGVLAISIFFSFFAFHIVLLLISEILCGIAWGVFQTCTTTYAAEIMPLNLRGSLTANVNLCWLLGQVTGLGVLRGMLGFNSEWSYRIPFALQWVWIVIIGTGMIWAPESPWYLVRHGRFEDAKQALRRLTSKHQHYEIENNVAMMVHTNDVEKEMAEGTTWWDCFKGSNLYRTEIACLTWSSQVLCGIPIVGYGTYFFLEAGFSEKHSFDLSTGMTALGVLASILSQVLMRYAGRRTIFLGGSFTILAILITAGSLSFGEGDAYLWALGAMIFCLIFVYDLTLGPICYCIVAEIPSTRLRTKTVVLARVAYNLFSLVSNVVQPQMLNPTAWNLKGKSCFLWVFTLCCVIVWSFFRLPEPKGLTYVELDLLFHRKAKARKFKSFQKTLESTGYFSFYDEPGQPVW